ncbi:hypothetical protein [Aeromicrobium sp. Sec7.5]
MEQEPRRQEIDWRTTLIFCFWITSPVLLLAIYLLGVELLTIVAFRNFGE